MPFWYIRSRSLGSRLQTAVVQLSARSKESEKMLAVAFQVFHLLWRLNAPVSAQSNQLICTDAISTAVLVLLTPSMGASATNIPWSRHVFWEYADSVLGIKIRLCVCLSHVSFVRAIFPLSVFYISFIFYLIHCRLLCTKLSW